MQNKSHIQKGFAIACVFIIFNVFRHISKTYFDEWTSFVSWGIVVVGVLASILFYNKQINQNSSFSSLFGYGFKTAAVATCLVIVYTTLAVYFVFPNFTNELLQQTMEQAKKAGANSVIAQDQAEMAKKVVKISFISMTLMGTLFLGVIGSLLGAVAAKKNPQPLN